MPTNTRVPSPVKVQVRGGRHPGSSEGLPTSHHATSKAPAVYERTHTHQNAWPRTEYSYSVTLFLQVHRSEVSLLLCLPHELDEFPEFRPNRITRCIASCTPVSHASELCVVHAVRLPDDVPNKFSCSVTLTRWERTLWDSQRSNDAAKL